MYIFLYIFLKCIDIKVLYTFLLYFSVLGFYQIVQNIELRKVNADICSIRYGFPSLK